MNLAAGMRSNKPATGGAYGGRSPREAAERGWKWARMFHEQCTKHGPCPPLDLVVEVGSGDSLIVPILWVGLGAQRAWGMDAFADPRSVHTEREIVRCALEIVPPSVRSRILEAVELTTDGLHLDEERIRYIAHTPLHRIAEHVPDGSVSVMCSVSVLEHVWSLEAALSASAKALRRDGVMCHHIDLRSHGVLSEFGESAFLQPPRAVWWLMGSQVGFPNRSSWKDYERILRGHGLRVWIDPTSHYDTSPLASPHDGVATFWLTTRFDGTPSSS